MLRHPTVDSTRILDAHASLLLEPAWQQMLEEARASAREEGFEAGRLAGQQEASEAAARAAAAIQKAVEGARAEAAGLRDDWADELIRRAVRLVENLTGELRSEPEQVLARVQVALDELDGSDLEVRVSPGDADVVSTGLETDGRVDVVADPNLGHGEARIIGLWCDADLTWSTALEVMKEELGA